MALAALPIAHADEAKADCEPGQAWIGYGQSDSLRALYYSLVAPGDPRVSGACEGEHWDGQDTVSGYHPGTSSTASCTSTTPPGSTTVTVASCMGPDINSGGAAVPAKPLATRASATASDKGGALYFGVDIPMVGRAAVYQGVCVAGGSIEGFACVGQAQTRTGVYLRDNTNQINGQDVLAGAVSSTGITKGHASEADCTQLEYETGARTGDKNKCGRDNTAITIETLLP